jgi:hypothetical protein
MKEVELSIDNSTKCLCPVCPVQTESDCTAAKRPGWEKGRMAAGDILTEYPDHPEAFGMEMGELEATQVGRRHGFKKPDTDDMMELYCSSAVSSSNCKDLDAKKSCQCPSCAVWATHGLGSYYYCLGKR